MAEAAMGQTATAEHDARRRRIFGGCATFLSTVFARQGSLLVFVLTYLSYVFYHCQRASYSAVKRLVMLNVGGINKATLGRLDFGFLVMYAIGQFAYGVGGDLLASSKVLLVSGMYAVSVTGALFAMVGLLGVQSAVPYTILRLMDGLFQASGWSQSLAIWGAWFPRTGRGMMLGVWASNVNVGDILGFNIAGAITGQDEHGDGDGSDGDAPDVTNRSWEYVILTSSLLVCVMATINMIFLKGSPPVEVADIDTAADKTVIAEEEGFSVGGNPPRRGCFASVISGLAGALRALLAAYMLPGVAQYCTRIRLTIPDGVGLDPS